MPRPSALAQLDSDSARAMPTWPSGPVSSSGGREVDAQGHGRDPHRRARVLPGVERRAPAPWSGRRRAGPSASPASTCAGRQRRVGTEGAALEQDWMIGWASRPRPTAAGSASSSASSTARLSTTVREPALAHGQAERRQQRRAQGHADHAQRQLHQPVGVEQVGHRAGRQVGREPAADQQVDLHHADTDDRRARSAPAAAGPEPTDAARRSAGARPARAAATATQASCSTPGADHTPGQGARLRHRPRRRVDQQEPR